ncbi:hypothetical protein OG235_36975 [Streptomyces sp. NBC_00024]
MTAAPLTTRGGPAATLIAALICTPAAYGTETSPSSASAEYTVARS